MKYDYTTNSLRLTYTHFSLRSRENAALINETALRFPAVVHGGWASWAAWGPCSATTCGGLGTRKRARNCTDPCPQNGGDPCHGLAESVTQCTTSCKSNRMRLQVFELVDYLRLVPCVTGQGRKFVTLPTSLCVSCFRPCLVAGHVPTLP